MALATSTLLTHFGWRVALRILAVTHFLGLSLCALIVRRCVPLVTSSSGNLWVHLFRDRRFTIMFCSVCLNSLGLYMPCSFLPLTAQRHGLSS